jgi:hypothetical protein
MPVPAALTETQAIQQLMASKGGAPACKAAAAAGLDPEAIREVIAAKSAAVKAAATKAGAGAVVGTAPPGVEPDLFQQALTAKAGGGIKAATGATKVGLTGAGPDIIREAVVSKAISGAGAGAVGKGVGIVGASTGSSLTADAITTGGTLWTGKGFSLGLGIGLGAWGPVLLVAGIGGAAYAYWRYRQSQIGTDEQVEEEVADEGFYPAKG